MAGDLFGLSIAPGMVSRLERQSADVLGYLSSYFEAQLRVQKVSSLLPAN
jgi:hypothetical protein